MILQLVINKAANQAIDTVAKELGIDRKNLRAKSNYNNETNLIEIEVYGKNVDKTFFTTNPDTLELTKVLTYYQ